MLPYSLFVAFVFAWMALAQPTGLDLSKDEMAHLTNDPEITHKVSLMVTRTSGSSEEDVGNLVFGMFGGTVPKTVDNFIGLATKVNGYGYENCLFHRIIKDFVVQGGDFERSDGTGGYSIYDKSLFKDEDFSIKHNKKGRLSMANAGPNTNGAQFFVLTGDSSASLDGRHVVFGQLILGFDVLEQLNVAKTKTNDRPLDNWTFNLASVTDVEGKIIAGSAEKDKETSETEQEKVGDELLAEKVPEKGEKSEKAEKWTESTKASELGSLSSIHYLGLVGLFSFAGYYALRWSRRRHGITITGFRS